MNLFWGLLGALVGLAAAWLWGRPGGRGKALAMDALAEPGRAPSGGGVAEMHLVLNVLNRVSMALAHSEHHQLGCALLADYLRAMHRAGSNGPATSDEVKADVLRETLTTHLALMGWFFGRDTPELVLEDLVAICAQAQPLQLAVRVQQALRQVERLPLQGVSLRALPGAAQSRPQIEIVLGPGASEHAEFKLPQGWALSGPRTAAMALPGPG